MVRELLEQRADLTVADLTITFDREQVEKEVLLFQKQFKTVVFLHLHRLLILLCHS